MKQLIIKARSGVTLVELLVVILIVTILSVSLLPLLKPYIEESKYAAEPIPVLANLQTKIELYQYDKDHLPWTSLASVTNAMQTWYSDANNTTNYPVAKSESETSTDHGTDMTSGHLQHLLDVDWQDLTGRRMKPKHFQYVVGDNTGPSRYCYAIGVMGDGDGLGVGTGYAVCKIVKADANFKAIATWKKYKATIEGQYQLHTMSTIEMNGVNIPVPSAVDVGQITDNKATHDAIKNQMIAAGWEF